MKPTKEAQKLAPQTKEVLEGLGVKCPKCGGRREMASMLNPLPYPHRSSYDRTIECSKCDNTGKLHYSWQPQAGEWFQCGGNLILLPQRNEFVDWRYNDKTLTVCYGHSSLVPGKPLFEYNYPLVKCTPILPWETLVEILESIGYGITVTYEGEEEVNRRGCCSIWKEGQYVVESKRAKDCQEAVMLGVVELEEEKKQ